MEEYLDVLQKCSIFKGMENEYIKNILKEKNYKIVNYNKGDIIAIEDSECEYIGIVLSGSVEIENIYESGRSLTIQRFIEGSTFGEAIVFSTRKTYPATVMASVKSNIMFIPNNTIIELCSSDKNFLWNFMALLSEKVLMINNKMKIISLSSIRQKLAKFILEQVNIQKSEKIKLNVNKKELAEYLGIQRPSLSRELIRMQEDGILESNKNEINVLDMNTLKEIMCK
ncbi:Crp/Fnr family transcriptional regulator [Clostridium gasigenes]|uniref:Crp/Fnr family transcriptional regulator n=1 Tax=Clostridium gasigenes TaxID=94869 RepID=A0A7X0SA55_9CLOT|nr:Crp/Fnr family transcriptional regulator [Clostridium gasigenes]MBB6622319.1 Crp/Fnr family transcriptional regulator [Clostridium gasigenes]MBB6713840.1 Crp/Fnr family transcriptional regulator [Clostridium gasigenes]MBU3087100.1 Crp/Fnr family transcriptional regulator [Clostridium gasigenes]MBU3131082.1 Crp/Fnr family transcriptional regulator [Clostridium gasigenes]NKF07372.1 Crp/Fnr family transcriptional regulator [Clostridium gasigenes]